MRLTQDRSLCETHQKIIVSKDHGTSRTHRADNTRKRYAVRQYKLDGDIISDKKCCDFLLLNDTLKDAYFIELKGGNVDEAIPQLESGLKEFQAELKEYPYYFRAIPSKVRTHDVRSSKFKRFKDRWGSRLQYKTEFLEEQL